MRALLLLAVGLCGCATVRPSSVTAEVTAGRTCYGRECGPETAVGLSATWDLTPAPAADGGAP